MRVDSGRQRHLIFCACTACALGTAEFGCLQIVAASKTFFGDVSCPGDVMIAAQLAAGPSALCSTCRL